MKQEVEEVEQDNAVEDDNEEEQEGADDHEAVDEEGETTGKQEMEDTHHHSESGKTCVTMVLLAEEGHCAGNTCNQVLRVL